jgi:hypothetical protein
MYAQLAASEGANFNQARDLAEKYQKNQRGNMPISNVRSCTHIKVDGVRCGSPALRGEQFCYFHQRLLRGVPTPPRSRLHPIAMIESPEAIQVALMEIINALARNTIDVKRAELILRALNIAARNARNVYFGLHDNEMVKQIPEYEDVGTAVSAATRVGADNARVGTDALVRPGGPDVSGRSASVKTAHVGTAPVGTDALVRPGGPDVPGRGAPQNDLDLPSTAAEPFARPPRELSQREFWKRETEEIKRQTAEIRAAREREAWHAAHPGVDPLAPKPVVGAPPKPVVGAPKPPVGVKAAPAQQQKKTNAAAG